MSDTKQCDKPITETSSDFATKKLSDQEYLALKQRIGAMFKSRKLATIFAENSIPLGKGGGGQDCQLSTRVPSPQERTHTSTHRPKGGSLPLSCPPKGLSRTQAAEYIGLGTTKFDEMVKDGRMPLPRSIDTRKVWDRNELDSAFEALPVFGVEKTNEWDEVLI